ncbi:MAG: phosphohydrolase [Rhodothermales bacterium]
MPDWKTPSPKEEQLDRALLSHTDGRLHEAVKAMVSDKEINLYHSYANVVSVRRLGYNDHGPVHARVTTYNALKLMRLLHEGGVETSLVAEDVATYEDSCFAVALGCFLHDLGMSVTRERHEWHSIILADKIITRYLDTFYPDDLAMQIVLRSVIHESIVGHMAHDRIHSLEAGVVLVADGTDMTRGRSRIPMNLERDPMVGDMHRYSANSITRVDLGPGANKPVRLTIQMNDVTGLFQIEEVLMTKVKASPIMPFLEIAAEISGQEPKLYLR